MSLCRGSLVPRSLLSLGGEGPGDKATSYPAHVERAFSCGENLENEATVYLFFSFAPCGSKERESGYRAGNFHR